MELIKNVFLSMQYDLVPEEKFSSILQFHRQAMIALQFQVFTNVNGIHSTRNLKDGTVFRDVFDQLDLFRIKCYKIKCLLSLMVASSHIPHNLVTKLSKNCACYLKFQRVRNKMQWKN